MDKRRSNTWCTVHMEAIIPLVGSMGRLISGSPLIKWIAITLCPHNTKATSTRTTRDNNSACNTKTFQTWSTLDHMTRLRNPAINQARWQGGKKSVTRAETRLKLCTSLQLKGILKSIILWIRMQSRNPQLPHLRDSLQNQRSEPLPAIKSCKTLAKKSGLQLSTKKSSSNRAQRLVFISWQAKPTRIRLASRQVSTIMRSRTKRAIRKQAIFLRKKETIRIWIKASRYQTTWSTVSSSLRWFLHQIIILNILISGSSIRLCVLTLIKRRQCEPKTLSRCLSKHAMSYPVPASATSRPMSSGRTSAPAKNLPRSLNRMLVAQKIPLRKEEGARLWAQSQLSWHPYRKISFNSVALWTLPKVCSQRNPWNTKATASTKTFLRKSKIQIVRRGLVKLLLIICTFVDKNS